MLPYALAGLALNTMSNQIGAATNYQFSKKFYNYQRQIQEDMYNKYTSPAAMRRQYQEAGFNPYLAAGGSAELPAVGGSSISTPYQSPQVDLVGALQAQNQADLIASQRDKLKADTDYTEALTYGQTTENWVNMRSAIVRSSLPDAEKQKLLTEVDNMKSQIQQRSYQNDKIEAETDFIRTQQNTQLILQKLYKSQISKTEAETLLTREITKSEPYKRLLMSSQRDAAAAEAALKRTIEAITSIQETQLNSAKIELIKKQTETEIAKQFNLKTSSARNIVDIIFKPFKKVKL